MSTEQPAAFTNSRLEDAAEGYEPDPSKVPAVVYLGRLLACDACPMQRREKCLAGGLCCDGIVTLAARKPDAKPTWPHCGWAKILDGA